MQFALERFSSEPCTKAQHLTINTTAHIKKYVFVPKMSACLLANLTILHIWIHWFHCIAHFFLNINSPMRKSLENIVKWHIQWFWSSGPKHLNKSENDIRTVIIHTWTKWVSIENLCILCRNCLNQFEEFRCKVP